MKTAKDKEERQRTGKYGKREEWEKRPTKKDTMKGDLFYLKWTILFPKGNTFLRKSSRSSISSSFPGTYKWFLGWAENWRRGGGEARGRGEGGE